jgi:hypothetical protein
MKNILTLFTKRIFTAFKLLSKSSGKAFLSVLKLLFIVKPLIVIKAITFLFKPALKWIFGASILSTFGVFELDTISNRIYETLEKFGLITFFRLDYIYFSQLGLWPKPCYIVNIQFY